MRRKRLRHRDASGRTAHLASWSEPRNALSSAYDEAALIDQARAGNAAAFEALYQRYERPIYVLAYRMLGNPDDAFDLTQDCFLRAYTHLGRTSADLNISAWLHRIAANACLDVLRRRQRIRWQPWNRALHESLLPAGLGDDPERIVLAGENGADVQRVLDRMSPRNRLALVLREHQGLSAREIGDVMGISVSAVKSVLFRGREEFRRIYSELYGDAPAYS